MTAKAEQIKILNDKLNTISISANAMDKKEQHNYIYCHICDTSNHSTKDC